MYYKQLGKTGKEISAISFGSMRFLPKDYKEGPEKCAEILLRAQELGINLFDTAPEYCHDQSEKIVGHAIKQMKVKPYVSTKGGFRQAVTAEETLEAVKKSRDRLCVDKITFYHMWCIKTVDEYKKMTAPGGIYEGLLRAKQDGLIEHICCSAHMDSEGVKVIAADGLVESVILGYNALNFAWRREGIKACHDAGMGVLTMNPLGGGLIPKYADAFSFLKNAPDESIVHAALRFLLGQKEVTAALPGPSSIAELEDCVAAADREYETSEAVFETYAKHLKEDLNTLCTSCGYCMECPVDLPIVEFLASYNHYLLTGSMKGMDGYLEGMWNLSPAVAGTCIRCGHCETLCTQKLPIMDRLAEFAALVAEK